MDARTITEVRSEMNELQITLNKLQATFNKSNAVLAQRVVELDRELATTKFDRDTLLAKIEHITTVFKQEPFSAKGLAALEKAINTTPAQCLAEIRKGKPNETK